MPAVTERKNKFARVFCYGAPKMRKTWWALKAAELGFNVYVLDSDDGLEIANQINPEAQKRIYQILIKDRLNTAIAAPFMASFLKGSTFKWDETNSQFGLLGTKEESNYVLVNPSKLTENDFLITDSWSRLALSAILKFAKENNIELSQIERLDRSVYGFIANYMNWVLSQIGSVNCHLVVIGHEQHYEKTETIELNNKKETRTIWERTLPMSSTQNNAKIVTSAFSEIFYFTKQGEKFKIDTRVVDKRDGGSRAIKPGIYDWEELTIETVLRALNIPIPSEPVPPSEAFQFFTGAELIEFEKTNPSSAGQPAYAARQKPTIKLATGQTNT